MNVNNQVNYSYYSSLVNHKFHNESFWDNILYLENLKHLNIYPIEDVEKVEQLVVYKAISTSKINKLIFRDNYRKAFWSFKENEADYCKFTNFPVYYNNRYEISNILSPTQDEDDIKLIEYFSIKNTSFSLLELYYYVRDNNDLRYRDFILDRIKTTIAFSDTSYRLNECSIDYDGVKGRLYNVFINIYLIKIEMRKFNIINGDQ